MKKLCFALFLLVFNRTYSQTTPTPPAMGATITQAIPASADAAALGKYGSIPVSPYTGVPNISIPLYTIKSGDLTLPVSLSYHSSGFKTEEMASSVGLGWVLNAGGSITRTQRGKADEDLNGFLTTSYATSVDNMLHNYNTLTSAQKSQLDIYLNQIADGTIDGEADVFNYNFGGYSGKFIMDSNNNFYTIPLANIKFTVTVLNGQTTNITAFTAKTPDGVTYYFGSNAATEYTNSPASKRQTAMSWFVYRIVSPSLHEIDFTYTPESYTTSQAPSQTAYAFLGFYGGYQPANQIPTPQPILPSGSSVVYTTVKLAGIAFENGALTVYANSNRNDLNPSNNPGKATAVDSILVASSGMAKKYKFYYLNTTANRLRLDSLIGQLEPISGTNKFKKEKYSFEYSSDPWNSNQNANFLFQQDWWGYYNGRLGMFQGTSNPTLIPTNTYTAYNNTVTMQGANRATDEVPMLGGLLDKIVYPGGGYTTFSFEANDENNKDLQGTSSSRYWTVTNLAGLSNDPGSIWYHYANQNINVYALPNQTLPVRVDAYGFSGANGPPNDFITAGLYDSSGASVYYPIPDGTSYVNLPAGTYTIKILDNKKQAYDPTGNPNGIKYSVGATWTGYTQAELNDMANNHIVGGARIKQIADYDGLSTNPTNLKTYTYKRPNSTISSGFLDFQPIYNYELDIETNTNTGGGYPQNTVNAYLTSTSFSNYPLTTTQGSVVGYAHVQELLGPNGVNGMNEYFYTNSQSNPDLQNLASLPFAPAESQDWHRGLLLKETNWKSTGSGTYAKVKELVNVYSTIKNITYPPLIKAGFNPKPDPGTYSQFASYYTNPASVEFGRVQEATYHDLSDYTYLSSDTTRIYDQNDQTKALQTVSKYQFDTTTYQLTQLQTVNSKNEKVTQLIKYPNNYSGTVNAGITNLLANGITTYPIEEITQKSDTNGNNLRTVKAIYTTYKSTKPYRDSVYEMRSVSPVTNFTGAASSPIDSRYQPVVVFNAYDAYGNILKERKIGDAIHNYIWGYPSTSFPYNNTYPIAEVINPAADSIAYTNFESYVSGGLGNWAYSNSGSTTDATAPMGSQCYTVSSTNTISKGSLNSGSKYVVSFWSKSGAAITVTGGTVTNVATGNAKNGWIYHEYSISGATSVTIGGTGAVDELRLYPSTAQMSTYTYIPLVGMASKCDTKNDITYYVYDNVGRLIQILDQNKNVVKQYQYNYANSAQ